MRLYLDLCCFNRPYDDQTQSRIRIETEAKVILQQKLKAGECELLWSSILDFECSKNPFTEHRLAIMQWRKIACAMVMADVSVLGEARRLMTYGVGTFDALHVASAMTGRATFFVTTDDRLLKRLKASRCGMRAMLPQKALAVLENWYEN